MAESRFNDGDLEKQVAELSDHIGNILKTSTTSISFASTSSEFTATSAGFFCGYARKSSNTNNASISFNSTVKGNSFLIISSSESGQYIPVTFPVAKGEKITVASWSEFNYMDGQFQAFK